MPVSFPFVLLKEHLKNYDASLWDLAVKAWDNDDFNIDLSTPSEALMLFHSYPDQCALSTLVHEFNRKLDDVLFQRVKPYDELTTSLFERFINRPVTCIMDHDLFKISNCFQTVCMGWGASSYICKPDLRKPKLVWSFRDNHTACMVVQDLLTSCRRVPISKDLNVCRPCSAFLTLTYACYTVLCSRSSRRSGEIPRGHAALKDGVVSVRRVQCEPIMCYWCEFGLFHRPVECNRLNLGVDKNRKMCANCRTFHPNSDGSSLRSISVEDRQFSNILVRSCNTSDESDEMWDKTETIHPKLRLKFNFEEEFDFEFPQRDFLVGDYIIARK